MARNPWGDTAVSAANQAALDTPLPVYDPLQDNASLFPTDGSVGMPPDLKAAPSQAPSAPASTRNEWGDDPAEDVAFAQGDTNAWGDPVDTGMGRLESAWETFKRSTGETVGGAMQGLGTLAGNVINPGGRTENELLAGGRSTNERAMEYSLKAQTFPEGSEQRAFWENASAETSARSRELLAAAQSGETIEDTLSTPGRNLREGAALDTNPNPAYAKEFWTADVPAAIGNAAVTVPAAAIPVVGPAVAGVGMGGLVYQTQLEQNLAAGMDPQTAEEKALLTAGINAPLEAIGGRIVGNSMKRILRGAPIAGQVATAAAGEGIEEFAQNIAGDTINKGVGEIDLMAAARAGLAGAVAGGGMAGVTAIPGAIINRQGTPEQDAPPAIVDENGNPLPVPPTPDLSIPADPRAAQFPADGSVGLPPAAPEVPGIPQPAPPISADSPAAQGSTAEPPVSSGEAAQISNAGVPPPMSDPSTPEWQQRHGISPEQAARVSPQQAADLDTFQTEGKLGNYKSLRSFIDRTAAPAATAPAAGAMQPAPAAATAPVGAAPAGASVESSQDEDAPEPLQTSSDLPTTPEEEEEMRAAVNAAIAEFNAEQAAATQEYMQQNGERLDTIVRSIGLPTPGSKAYLAAKGEYDALAADILESRKQDIGRGRKSKDAILAEWFHNDAADDLFQSLEEKGFGSIDPGTLADMLSTGIRTGQHAVGMGTNADIPFSVQPAPRVTTGQVATAQQDATRIMAKLRSPLPVTVHREATTLPDAQARRVASQRGKIVEAYLSPRGTVEINLDGVARIAKARGISVEKRMRQIVLHEAVGHSGVNALFANNLPEWHSFADRMWKRYQSSTFSPADAARLGYASLRELATLYKQDIDTDAGRRAVIAEHIARVAERGIRPPWWQSLIDLVRATLRKLGFKLADSATNAEIASLLAKGSRAVSGEAGNGEVAFSLRKFNSVAQVWSRATATQMLRNKYLDAGAIEALERYQDGAYQRINEYLRDPKGTLEEYDLDQYDAETIAGLDRATRSQMLAEDTVLYRRGIPYEILNSLKMGDTFTDAAFVSTSLVDEAGESQYQKPVEIIAPKGSRGVFLDYFDKHNGEVEWLLPRGSYFTKDADRNGRTVLRLNATGATEAAPALDSRQSQEGEPGAPTRARDVRLADRATEATINPVRGADTTGAAAGQVQFSLQPDPDTRAIERALVADPAKLKEHGLTARMREEQPDVFGTVAKGLYATYSDADAIRHAQAWLGQRTEAEATATLMSLKLGQADKMTMTAAQLLTEKLAGEGRIGEASDLARSTATIATTMGQAIQSLHMMMRLGDEAAMLTFAAKEIVDAAKEKATTQEMTAAMSAMEGLRNLLEKEQAQNGYLSMIQHQAAIIEAAEVAQAQLESEIRSLVDALTRANTPAQRADLQQRIDELDLKLRMLEQTSRHELGKTREEIAKLRAALAKARAQLADLTGRGAERHLAEAIRIIEAARGLTTERQVELQKKIQSALTSDDGTDTAATRITGALIAAGMDRGKAQALAKKLVDTFRARSKQVRDSVLKQLAEGAAPKLTARIDRGVISKWQTANKHGHLDDAKLFEGIAKRWGFPVFTVADAAKVKDLVRQYNSTTNPEVRIMLATEMLDWMSRKAAHSNILDKARALFTLTKLMSFKTLERIFMSNTVAALAQTIAVDVPRIVLTATGSIFTGGKLVDTDTALGAMGTGLRETARIFKAGRVHGIEEGQNGVMAGMKTLIAAAKAHTSSINDARDLRKMAGSVFSSRAMRNMETMMHLVLSVPDYPRFAGEVKQSLARQMRAEGNEVPTAEQYKRAYLAGQRSIWLNYENAAKTASGLAKAINRISTLGITEKFGLGTVVSPFTRVPPNMLADALRWTPIGFIQAMYEGVMEAKNPEAGDQREAVNALLKAAAGTGALAVGAYLFRLGIVTGDDDDDRNIQNLRNATGWQKWSVNTSELSRRMETGDWTSPGTKPVEGDVFESFAWMQPAATIVAAGAAMEQKAQDRTTKGEPPAGWWTPFVDSLGGIKSFGDMPMVTGFSRLAQDMRQLEDSGKVAPLIAAYTRMFDFVPAIVRDIRYANNDAVSETRDANAVQAEWNRIIGQVTPDQLPQRYDILGRAQTKYDAARGSILKALIDPMTERVFRNTPAAAEALRLAESTGLTGQIPDKATTRIAINTSLRPGDTITRELNAREISELQRLMGTMSADLTTLAMLNPAYATMPDEARAKMLASNVAAGNTAAKMYLFGHVPGELTASGLQTDSRAILAFAIAQFRGIIPKDATIQKPVFPATK